jgi:asparagine synthase (glutamine-hydrolysing)
MCGLFGIVANTAPSANFIEAIHRLQAHRGPDDKRDWTGPFGQSSLTLAFERLSIIDLTSDAAQPFRSRQTGSMLVYNGEIYNYVEMRADLRSRGVTVQTKSDTEVLLAALDHFGIEEALSRLNGMFAFAYLCGRTGRLWLARDRVGEKPLYFTMSRSTFAFASEIKSLLICVPEHSFVPNPRVIHKFLVNGMVDDSDETFFENVKCVPPAHYGEVKECNGSFELSLRSYWPRPGSYNEDSRPLSVHVEECRALLSDAVKIRLRSDVPLGFLLSGGIDSSTIAALALTNGIHREQFNGYSIVNPELETDESKWIDSVANHLDVRLNKVIFNPNGDELLDQLTSYVHFHDEPISGLSVIAHAKLLKVALDHGITVLLSGQGGDELFCGYNKYFYFLIQKLLRDRRPLQATKLAFDFARNGTVLHQFTMTDAARYLKVNLNNEMPLGAALVDTTRINIGLGSGDVRERQLADLLRFSTPAITHCEDRASMASSREVRFPFLDWRLMEFALSLPVSDKVSAGWTKRVLRLAAEPLLPASVVWRKDKIGHFTATKDWVVARGRTLQQSLTSSSRIFTAGYIDAEKFLPKWNRFWSGDKTGLSVRDVVSTMTLDIWLTLFARAIRT